MTVSLNSIYNDDRTLEVQGSHPHPMLADSVFISGPMGFCIELNRRDFIEAVKEEFGLIEIPSTIEDFVGFTR